MSDTIGGRPDHDRVRRSPMGGGERRRRAGGGPGSGRSTRGGVPAILDELQSNPRWRERFVHWHTQAARPGRTADFPAGVCQEIRDVLAKRGIHELRAHQAEAIEAALSGKDVLVATPTASGKTLCYSVPVLQSLMETNGDARALFLFPTKALSQDQTVGITSLVEELGAPWHAYTYDGDTPPTIRRTLRDRGHLILTNPYMLHQGILPNHAKWTSLFRDLRYVVVDEVHTLSGVFGSSVANVLRRLQRIARHYGANPRFIGCSATVRDPGAHAERLFGREVVVVSEDASPSGERHFGVYDPPMINPVAGLRANALEEARELGRVLCGPRHQTIFFCGRRTAVEVLTRYLKENAAKMGLAPEEIRGYRGGYLPLMRREIEDGLRAGEIKVVVSTNALELGIDIGALDVAVLVGYPGSQASFWQRAGRVGRRGKPSLVVQISRSDPVDQFLAHHPEYLFGAPRERLSLDPDNLVILSEQLKCAAFELPFREATPSEKAANGLTLSGEQEYGKAPHSADILDYLAEESDFLHRRGSTWYWMADAYPAQDVTLTGDEADNVLILDMENEKAIGEIDREGSITAVHEGAIYQVQGETWRIERFDYQNRRAYARRVESDYFTDAHSDVEVRVLRLEELQRRKRGEAPVQDPWTPGFSEEGGAAAATAPLDPELAGPHTEDHSIWRGEVHVTTVATMYKKIRFYTRENVGAGEIHLPPEELDTEAFILTLSDASALELGLVGGERGAAWRAVGNLLRRVAPIYLRCQPSDLGLSSHVRSPHFKRPTLFLYDRVRGGVGLSELLYADHRPLLAAAMEVIERCACTGGCPACVGPLAEVGPLGKETAARVLAHLVGGPQATEQEFHEEELFEAEAGSDADSDSGQVAEDSTADVPTGNGPTGNAPTGGFSSGVDSGD